MKFDMSMNKISYYLSPFFFGFKVQNEELLVGGELKKEFYIPKTKLLVYYMTNYVLTQKEEDYFSTKPDLIIHSEIKKID